MSGLTLFEIDESLRELMTAREELSTELGINESGGSTSKAPEELREELAEVDRLLVDYTRSFVGKVDSIYYYLRASEIEMKAASDEAERFTARAKRIEANRARLKAVILQVMNEACKKRIDGTGGKYIARQANGGVNPLQVDGWDGNKWTRPVGEVPLDTSMMRVKVEMPVALLDKLRQLVPEINALIRSRDVEPDPGLIRAALGEDCALCDGRGAVAEAVCNLCGGDGKRVVPGARLLDRGEQLRLR